MAENKRVKAIKLQKTMIRNCRAQEELPKAAIQFDATFDRRSSKSATGLVRWDQKRDLLVLKTVVHNKVSSSFAAEAYACLESIKLGISLRMLSIKIMGDSKTIIKKCRKTSLDKLVIGLLSDISTIRNHVSRN
ncbi:hypothetical protein Godav_025710 [Gossypium davidsonii]|uniref:RNase H type-1 domain-containing protein n=2 Tax=Gossypium TaxID=3633 RepID=A0A7J8TEW9_GOSDV|nr:hypothetical protein [Gossypium davidsonii]MBA0671830.1 hypothetical protein [Gossypium klotzschianum]